jgi:HSP20 family protein
MKNIIPWRRRTDSMLDSLRHEMESLYERFFAEPPAGAASEVMRAWAPRVDVEETDKEILVKADLPGVDPKDVDISVSDNSLILRGEKKEEREEKKKNYRAVERFVGQFYREIPLPAGTDKEKITATTSKGVVTVTIPKAPQAQPKKIAVKAQD